MEPALAEGWPAKGVVYFARAWRAQRLGVILADGGIGEPSLPTVLGVPDWEGISDVVLFGPSRGRAAQNVGEDGLIFVPAGTPTAEPPPSLPILNGPASSGGWGREGGRWLYAYVAYAPRIPGHRASSHRPTMS